MKVNFKKLMTAISAISIFAVTMAVSATANEAGKMQNNAKTESKILVENVRQTAIVNRVNAVETDITIVDYDPTTKIIATGKNMSTCVWPDGSVITNCTEIKFRPDNASYAKEYLNSYNQVAGHAIKTTTVGVNK